VPARGYVPVVFGTSERGAWVRVTADKDCRRATAFFQYSNVDRRPARAASIVASAITAQIRTVFSGMLVRMETGSRGLS